MSHAAMAKTHRIRPTSQQTPPSLPFRSTTSQPVATTHASHGGGRKRRSCGFLRAHTCCCSRPLLERRSPSPPTARLLPHRRHVQELPPPLPGGSKSLLLPCPTPFRSCSDAILMRLHKSFSVQSNGHRIWILGAFNRGCLFPYGVMTFFN